MWKPNVKTTSQGEQNLTEGNKAYAASFTQGDLALPPSQKYSVCTLHIL
jgi:carbonic anhydrase